MHEKKFSVDITDTLPEAGEHFFHCRPIRLIHSGIGNYLEAETTPLSRFSWRIPIANPGNPHLLNVIYPDNKQQFMTVGDGTQPMMLVSGLSPASADRFPVKCKRRHYISGRVSVIFLSVS